LLTTSTGKLLKKCEKRFIVGTSFVWKGKGLDTVWTDSVMLQDGDGKKVAQRGNGNELAS
jgi:hypothetical protein